MYDARHYDGYMKTVDKELYDVRERNLWSAYWYGLITFEALLKGLKELWS